MAWNWGISIITFAFGLGIGFLLAWLVLPRTGRIRDLEMQLQATEASHEEYRGRVNQHFRKTADLFEDMTERYQAVYRHMAIGAQTLCGDQAPALRPPALHLNAAGRAEDTRLIDAGRAAEAAPAIPDTPRVSAEDDEVLGDAPHIPELTEEVSADTLTAPDEKATTRVAG